MKISSAYFILLIMTPVAYILASLSGVKLNYAFLLILFSFSAIIIFRHSKADFYYVITGLLLGLTMLLLQSEGAFNLLSFLMGSSIFAASAIIKQQPGIRKNKFDRFRLLFSWFSIALIILALLQFFEVIPITLWNLEFSNAASISFIEDGFFYARPNGFFYHPYDLCLYLMGFLSLLTKSGRGLLASVLYISLSAIILLKAWVVTCLYIINRTLIEKVNSKPLKRVLNLTLMLFGAMLLLLIYQKYGDVIFTGRLELWLIYIDIYQSYSIMDYLFGPNSHPLEGSYLWGKEYIPGAHNQILSFFVFWGWIATLYFISWSRRLIVKHGRFVRHELWIFAVVFFTLGLTGEVVSSPLIWIALASSNLAFYKDDNTGTNTASATKKWRNSNESGDN